MKHAYLFGILLVLALAAGCNEKIAPELANPSSATGPNAPTVSGIKKFYLKEKSPLLLGYQLHKTGAGNSQADCTIKSIDYDNLNSNDPTYDISCFLETEELSLNMNGVDFEINADANVCEYVAYSPFSFYQWQPGSSTMVVHRTNCSDVDTAAVQGLGGAYTNAVCNASVDQATFAVGSDVLQDLCQFDYSQLPEPGPNCDNGVITYVDSDCGMEDHDGDGDTPDILQCVPSPAKTHKCGGKTGACVNGPIREAFPEITTLNAASSYKIYETQKDKPFKQNFKISSPLSLKLDSNMYVANYMRQCSSANPLAGSGPSQVFTYPVANSSYSVLENFSADVIENYSTSPLFDSEDLDDNNSSTNPDRHYVSGYDEMANRVGWNVRVNADDPFHGRTPTNPSYAFYCLDRAYDVKARIRVYVRDWDRIFADSNPYMTFLSDVFLNTGTTKGRMDSSGSETSAPRVLPPFLADYNDVLDWDDWLVMDPACGHPNPSYINGGSGSVYGGAYVNGTFINTEINGTVGGRVQVAPPGTEGQVCNGGQTAGCLLNSPPYFNYGTSDQTRTGPKARVNFPENAL